MKKKIVILTALAMVVSAICFNGIGTASTAELTFYYGDVALSGGFEADHFLQVWDLTACDMVISFTYDANGLVDDSGAHAWAELGIRQFGSEDFNPASGTGIWLATDYDWSANTFDPDIPSPILDNDDKLILQKTGGNGEADYNLPSTPPNQWANHGVWFDRDGVDQWQAQMWGAIDGVTYNTGGIYEVVITLHATSATTGEAYMTINGEPQGFYDPSWHDGEPDLYPAGMSFTGDMTQMQVFYGIFGYGATHSVTFSDIEVAGCMVLDEEGMVTGGGWITSPAGAMPPMASNVTVSGTSGDTSVDPDAGSADYYLRYVGNPPPAGYDPDHNYQWGSPAVFTPSPEDGPVILQGTIDVDEQTVGQVAMIGLLDQDDLAAGNSSFQDGAYIYIYRRTATSWRIGLSDGNIGGEIVQAFTEIADSDLPGDGILNVTFTVDGTSDGTTCAVGDYATPAGCMTLQITGGSVDTTLTDSYGDVIGSNSASPEFANGAVLGWDDYIGSNVGFTLTVPSMTSGSPEGKATFGFISKYKKGASTPTGQTQFYFKAGDLNFHSDSYDWLVIAGAKAMYKGVGTINGEGEYKFMLTAIDADIKDNDAFDIDRFRIKIWQELGDTEYVVYDNALGDDNDNGTTEISGGSIVIHKKK